MRYSPLGAMLAVLLACQSAGANTSDERCKSILNFGRVQFKHASIKGGATSATEKDSSEGSEGKESGNGGEQSQQRRLPKPNHEFQVENLELTKSNQVPVLLAHSDVNADFWKWNHYTEVDPYSNKWRNPHSGTGQFGTIQLETSADKPDAQMHLVDLEDLSRGFLLVPQGYHPLATPKEIGIVERDAVGNYYLTPAVRSLSVPLKKTGKQTLTPEQERDYTQIDPIPDTLWPTWVREALTKLDAGQKRGLSDSVLAQELGAALIGNAEYADHRSPAGSVLDQARCKVYQCQGATSLATTLLRGRHIATRPAAGYPAVLGEAGGIAVYLPTVGHARIEVYDRQLQEWVPIEVTPHRAEKDPEEDQNDSTGGRSRTPRLNTPLADKVRRQWRGVLERLAMGKTARNAGAELEKTFKSHPELRHATDTAAIEAGVSRLAPMMGAPTLPKIHTLLERSLSKVGDYRRLRDGAKLYESVVDELSQLRRLKPIEEELYKGFVELTRASSSGEPSREEVGKSFYRLLPGQHSKRYVTEQAGQTARGTDWAALGDLVHTEKFQPLLRMVRAMDTVNFSLLPSEEPASGVDFYGAFDAEHTSGPLAMRTAETIDELPLVNTDGIRPEDLVLRLLRGELHYNVYRQENAAANTTDLVPRTGTALLEDWSGSMSYAGKYLVREGITAGLIDRFAQSDSDRIWRIPFTDVVQDPIEVTDPLATMKQKWYTPTGRAGENLIGAALAKAVELINRQRPEHFNVVLLSDGEEDTFDPSHFIKAIEGVFPKTRVNFTAVMLGGSNDKLKHAVKHLNSLLGRHGKGEYREISLAKVIKINDDDTTDAFVNAMVQDDAAKRKLPAYSAQLQRLRKNIAARLKTPSRP